MSADALYQAVKSGNVKLDDLNDEGKATLKGYMQSNFPDVMANPAQPEPNSDINSNGGVGDNSYGPTATISPPAESSWNGILDNPIVHGAETALSWVQKPFETLSTGIADTVGAVRNLSSSGNTVDYNGDTMQPSQSRNFLTDLKDIWSNTNEHVSSDAWQGANPNAPDVKGTNLNYNNVLDFAAQSIPLDVSPLLKAAKIGVNTLNDARLASKAESLLSKSPPLPDYSNVSLLDSKGVNKPITDLQQLSKPAETLGISESNSTNLPTNEWTPNDKLQEYFDYKKQLHDKYNGDETAWTPEEMGKSNELYNAVDTPPSKVSSDVQQPAEAMKQSWFSNLFGDQGIGVSAFKDTKQISKDPLTTEGQIVQKGIKNDAQGIKDTIAAQARAVYQNHVDQLSPLKTISKDTYDTAMDSARSNNIANNIIHDKFVTPEGNVVGQGLEGIFKKVARGQDSQFIDYLTLRHAETRMKRNEQVYADSLNMTTDKVRERAAMLEKRYPGFADIAKEWDGFNNNVLQHYGVNEGLISQDAYDALREKNPNYSPMNRQFSRSEKPGRSFLAKTTSSSFSGQKAPIKEVSKLGSARKIVDPRRSTIENVGAWVNASMRNRTMQSMVDAIKNDPESFSGIAEIVQKPKGGTDLNKVLMDGGTDDFVETLNQDFSNLFKKTNVDGENVVRAMVNGQPVYLKVHDPEIVKTLIGMGPQASNVLIDAMRAFSNATKRGATGLLSPVFAVKGATMDLVQSAIQARNPAKQAAYTVYAIFSGIGDRLNIPGLKNMAEEFRRSGGEYSAALKGDRKLNTSVSQLKRDPILSPQGVAKGLASAVKAPFRALEGLGNIAENAPRIAASKLELNRLGGARTQENVRQAMSAGREATVNYSRKGALSSDIEAFVPYNNASVQGTYRILKGMKDNPVRTAGAIGTLAVLPKLYEYAQFHDDHDYQNLPARERMRFLIVNKNNDGTFTKIPMDPAYNSIGEMTIEALRHFKDQDPTAFKGTADALANAWLSPAVTGAAQGITQGGGLDKSIVGVLNSTIAAPFVATTANQSFTGAPIVSKAVADRSTPYQYDERTSAVAKKLTEYTGMAPMKIDYLLRAYGGDPARLLLPLTSDAGGGNVKNTLLKNFIVDPAVTNTLTNDFYNSKDKIMQAYHDFKEVKAPLPPWFDVELYKMVSSTAKGSLSNTLSGLAAEKKSISSDNSLSATQKTEKLRSIQQQTNNIYMDINMRMEKQKVPKD
jgi:hypothetical protein